MVHFLKPHSLTLNVFQINFTMFDHVFFSFTGFWAYQAIEVSNKVYICLVPFEASVLSEGIMANSTNIIHSYIHIAVL